MRQQLGTGATGLGFGFVLSRVGFTSWDEVHGMFTFSSLRLFLAFVLAVSVLSLGWLVVKKVSAVRWGRRAVHPGSVAGGVLFGLGWALSGACPSIALVQLGEAQLGAVLTLVGIFGGNWLYSVVHERYFRWSAKSCSDD